MVLSEINGIPADLFIGRLLLGTTAVTGAIWTTWNILYAAMYLRPYRRRWTAVGQALYAIGLMWVGLIELYGTIDPFTFPNPTAVRIALQYALPLLVLWPPMHIWAIGRTARRLTSEGRVGVGS